MNDISADHPKLDPENALRSNLTKHLFRRISAHNSILIGGGVLGAIVLMALFAPLLAPHDPFSQDLSQPTGGGTLDIVLVSKDISSSE